MSDSSIKVLFSDIGGVLGTNGWDSNLRQRLCIHFGVSLEEIDPRHHLMFDSYERGHMTFEEYLSHVFFAEPREFSLDDVRDYTFAASLPFPEMLGFFQQVKKANGLKLGLISNEGQGITEHRVNRFGLRDLADFMVVSHYVRMRKPDREIWKLALNLAQVTPEESIYVDDRQIFVDVAAAMGFRAVQHSSLDRTREEFRSLGLVVD